MNDKLKYEVASELGIDTSKIQNGYWGHLTSRECGAIGGHMIRKLMATAEEALVKKITAEIHQTFQESLQRETELLHKQEILVGKMF